MILSIARILEGHKIFVSEQYFKYKLVMLLWYIQLIKLFIFYLLLHVDFYSCKYIYVPSMCQALF